MIGWKILLMQLSLYSIWFWFWFWLYLVLSYICWNLKWLPVIVCQCSCVCSWWICCKIISTGQAVSKTTTHTATFQRDSNKIKTWKLMMVTAFCVLFSFVSYFDVGTHTQKRKSPFLLLVHSFSLGISKSSMLAWINCLFGERRECVRANANATECVV